MNKYALVFAVLALVGCGSIGVFGSALPLQHRLHHRHHGQHAVALDENPSPKKKVGLQKNLLWKYTTGGNVTSPALSPDGSTVYIGSTDSNVYALDANTGALKWNFNTGGLNSLSWPNVHPVPLGGSSPIVTLDGNFVFIQSQRFCYDYADDFNSCTPAYPEVVLTALNANDGSVVWDVDAARLVDSEIGPDLSMIAPVLGPPGSGTIYAVNVQTNKSANSRQPVLQAYSIPTGQIKSSDGIPNVTYTPSISPDGNIMYFSSLHIADWDNNIMMNITAINIADQNEIWTTSMHVGIPGYTLSANVAVSPDGKTVFAKVLGRNLNQDYTVAINAATGATQWEFSSGSVTVPNPDGKSDTYASSMFYSGTAPLMISDDSTTLYISSNDGTMYALNTVSGKLIWSFRSSKSIRTTAILSGTSKKPYIYFGSDDGSIYMLNAKTGEQIDSYLTGGMVASSPAVKESRGNTTLFIGSDDGNLYAFSTTPC